MDKSRIDILSEIKESLESLKAQVLDLESRIAAIEMGPEMEETSDLPETEEDMSPIDISLDDEMIGDMDFVGAQAIQADAEPVQTTPEPGTEPEQAAEPKPVKKPEPVKEPDIVKEPEVEELLSTPVESINDKQEKKKSRKAVMDVMSEKCAWRAAIPGSPVKNIISAISLNDRVLLINTLFKEDAIAFQDAISTLNGMPSFAEAEEYIMENHPDWNLNSDIVYRLMMAIRRKLK